MIGHRDIVSLAIGQVKLLVFLYPALTVIWQKKRDDHYFVMDKQIFEQAQGLYLNKRISLFWRKERRYKKAKYMIRPITVQVEAKR